MLVYLFYVLPLLVACVYGLSRPGCGWMLDCTLVLAGAVTQVTMVPMPFQPVDSTKLLKLIHLKSFKKNASLKGHSTDFDMNLY